MSRLFYHVMQDNVGNLLFDVSGTMRLAGTGTLATIYGDEALTVVLPNPMTNHPSFGSFKCFLGAGDYDFYMAKAGYSFETLTGVQGHGTMAQQNADMVAITGGELRSVQVPNTGGDNVVGLASVLMNAGGTGRRFLLHQGDAPSALGGPLQVTPYVSVNETLNPGAALAITHPKDSRFGIRLHATVTDVGSFHPVVFTNVADATVGSIVTTATTTAYNTSSDGRLKEAIAALPDALETIQRLLPVTFRWKATGEPGHGFIAQDVQAVVPQAVTGNPDDPTPSMQMDYSKIVPFLVGAVQEMAQQIQALTARLEATEARA